MILRALPFLALVVAPAPALAHHVGAYTPQDNELTTNFKQVKFSVQAGKFDVARRLFEAGALRAQMRAKAATLPPGLESGTRAALQAGDAPEVERRLMIFEAEGYAKQAAAPEGAGLADALRRIAQILTHLIDTSSTLARRTP